MVVIEAVQAAKNHILELFKNDEIDDIEPEEVEFRSVDGTWIVTIGFQRRWSPPSTTPVSALFPASSKRTYKTVCSGDDGTLISLKPRDVCVSA